MKEEGKADARKKKTRGLETKKPGFGNFSPKKEFKPVSWSSEKFLHQSRETPAAPTSSCADGRAENCQAESRAATLENKISETKAEQEHVMQTALKICKCKAAGRDPVAATGGMIDTENSKAALRYLLAENGTEMTDDEYEQFLQTQPGIELLQNVHEMLELRGQMSRLRVQNGESGGRDTGSEVTIRKWPPLTLPVRPLYPQRAVNKRWVDTRNHCNAPTNAERSRHALHR